MRRIKNRGKLKKGGLINSILKSESSNAERNYMKHFDTNADKSNVDNNANGDDDDDDDDDTYDGKIRDIISDIRMILSRLGNTTMIEKKLKKSFLK